MSGDQSNQNKTSHVIDTQIKSSGATITEFLEAAAAKRPTPGGGATAALAGALAASMGEMVLNYSIGKKTLLAHEPALKSALGELTNARNLLLALMVEDQHAYLSLSAAQKLEESDADRPASLAAALVAAIRTPESISAVSLRILDISLRVAPIGNKWLLSDLLVCCELAMASVRSGIHNVRVNLADIGPGDRVMVERECDETLARAVALVRQVVPLIQKLQSA